MRKRRNGGIGIGIAVTWNCEERDGWYNGREGMREDAVENKSICTDFHISPEIENGRDCWIFGMFCV
jgi:hypothetical protein